MSVSHRTTLSIKNDAGSTVVAATTSYTAAAEENIDSVAGASDTLVIDLAIDVSQIVSFFIYSDKDVTLKTNDDGTPDQTIALDAKKPLWWNTDANGTNPLTTDITKLSFVNAGLEDAKIKCGFLLDVDS